MKSRLASIFLYLAIIVAVASAIGPTAVYAVDFNPVINSTADLSFGRVWKVDVATYSSRGTTFEYVNNESESAPNSTVITIQGLTVGKYNVIVNGTETEEIFLEDAGLAINLANNTGEGNYTVLIDRGAGFAFRQLRNIVDSFVTVLGSLVVLVVTLSVLIVVMIFPPFLKRLMENIVDKVKFN